MKTKKIFIDEKNDVYIETYILKNSKELLFNYKRPLILICPGGGYYNLSDREAEPIALKFNAEGYHAIVLRYSIKDNAKMPKPLIDIAETMLLINKNVNGWLVDENKIFICGFSAGGHLAAGISVFYNNEKILPNYNLEQRKIIKPKGTILGYPVIDLKETSTKMETNFKSGTNLKLINWQFKNSSLLNKEFLFEENGKIYANFEVAMNSLIIGGSPTDELIKLFSLHNQVNDKTPPAFIWHGGEDKLIFPENSRKYYNALLKHNVKESELHIFKTGDHGLSLATSLTANKEYEINEECSKWFDLCVAWLNKQCGINKFELILKKTSSNKIF